MSRMYEFLNPQSHTVQLSSPDKKIIKIPPRGKIILPEWFKNYCPKYLRIIREVGGKNSIKPKKITTNVKYTPPGKGKPRPNKKIQNRVGPRGIVEIKTPKPQIPKKIRNNLRKPVVGRRTRETGAQLFKESCQNNDWTVSNNVGIGILSYNRLNSLRRLINSIRAHTDLSKTTVFVSDESDNVEVQNWLRKQTDIVVLTGQERIGIAGNSNRLFRCLSRFKYGIILNDDVEILKDGWETFYIKAHAATKIHHFCYRQPGIYGAKKKGQKNRINHVHIETIPDKPHGAVIFFTNQVFNKVGYFDEQFGYYGMEHVDWSQRVSDSGIQLTGFHDVVGSDQYFKIHQEKSVVPARSKELSKAREVYRKINNPKVRVYVGPTDQSIVPSVSVVIPIRNIGRQIATEVVVHSIRSQLFPNIEIIISEQDDKSNLKLDNIYPCRYFFAKNKYTNQPFTKAMAFNLGVANASYSTVVLQDADICCSSRYVEKVHELLKSNEAVHIGSKVLYMSQDATNKITAEKKIDSSKHCERAVGYFEGGSLACTKNAYFRCGGFNEIYEGYGIEDCDFFDRLKYFVKFYNTRSEDLVHLWHGRTSGWEIHHRRNKKIFQQLKKQYNMNSYVASLVLKMREQYPEATKELGI